ncbi:MAG: phosphoribosyltransferase family protein [Minisyncoccia bacterium]
MNTARTFLLDLIFPRYCLGCSELINKLDESHVCPSCYAQIPFKTNFICAFCSSQVILGKTCPFCRKDNYLDRLIVASDYDYPLVEKMIKAVKYRYLRSLGSDIGKFMANFFEKKVSPNLPLEPGSIVITAVPLHRRRLNDRGYNQSELAAREIGKHFNWPYQELLVRGRNNPPQAEIKDRQTRVDNMKGVFELASAGSAAPAALAAGAADLSGKTIILVDDVSTTGSTLNDCARVLKSAGPDSVGAGAKEVIGFVFARNR